MRISIDEKDAGFGERYIHAKVFLDGVELTDCVTADDEQGMVVCYDFSGSSNLKDVPLIKRYGVVRIDLSAVPEI